MRTTLQRLGLGAGIALLLLAASFTTKAGDKTAPKWTPLFDGKSLAGWKETNFGGEGEVRVEAGTIILERGSDMTGITCTRKNLPTMNYELQLEGKRLKGNDFFCTTTFPVGTSHCSLVVGGWGGSTVGLSNLDGKDASQNATTSMFDFDEGRWYAIRVRVTEGRIRAWIGAKKVVDADTKGKKVTVRAECLLCRPLGVVTWRTVGAVRGLRVRPLTAKERD